jgi:hypothetical protein
MVIDIPSRYLMKSTRSTYRLSGTLDGRLTNAQLPETVEARLCVLNDTDSVLSQQLLYNGELAAPTDKNYLRRGDGITSGGTILANGNTYIENNVPSSPSIIGFTTNGSGLASFSSISVIPSQNFYFQVNNSGELFKYDGLWTGALNFSDGFSTIVSITVNNVIGATSVSFASYSNLVSVSMPSLKICTGDFRNNSSSANQTILDLPSLVVVGGAFLPNGNNITTLNIPLLKSVGSTFGPSGMTNLVNFNISSLKYVIGSFSPGGSSISFNNMNSLITINASSLEFVGSISLGAMSSLTTVSFPSLVTVNGLINITSSATGSNLTNFSIGSGLKHIGGNVTITGQKLTAASIENILVRLAALDGTSSTISYETGRTVNLSGGTSSGLSALTTNASNARATLLARGVTVTLND